MYVRFFVLSSYVCIALPYFIFCGLLFEINLDGWMDNVVAIYCLITAQKVEDSSVL